MLPPLREGWGWVFMLSFIPYLVIFALICLVGDLYSWRPEGVMRRQLVSIVDIKNERSFNADEGGLDISRFLLIAQFFVFFGLVLYTNINPDYFEDLMNPDQDTWYELAICIAIPSAWFFIQWVLYHWWSYIFHVEGKAVILSRIYKAIHMLAAPIALMVFLLEIVDAISPDYSWILLLLTFIIAQIVFIFSGIRIFWSGIGTLCFIFVYLCAFKIAPILLLLSKLG